MYLLTSDDLPLIALSRSSSDRCVGGLRNSSSLMTDLLFTGNVDSIGLKPRAEASSSVAVSYSL